ncbi:MAG: type II toxin-antitoxin system RelE/ParE family toxin [Kofleriaceae bacterium]
MRERRISPAAQDDLDAILEVSEQRWGTAARGRYEAIIAAAFRQIAGDPTNVTRRERRAPARGARSLHLESVSTSGAVDEPVHIVSYRVTAASIEIIRVLHERMHVVSQLRRR